MKYCAFLRGVNVNGINIKMADVCTVFQNAGMENVSSVLATGNVIFESEKNSAELKPLLEKAMSENFGYEAFIFVKNQQEVEGMLAKCPFETAENLHTYLFVTTEGTPEILLEAFEKSQKSPEEKGAIAEGNFYWQVPKGSTLDSDFGKILGRKNMKDKITSRNINTFEKIVKKFN